MRFAIIVSITGGTLLVAMWATSSLEIALAGAALVSALALEFV